MRLALPADPRRTVRRASPEIRLPRMRLTALLPSLSCAMLLALAAPSQGAVRESAFAGAIPSATPPATPLARAIARSWGRPAPRPAVEARLEDGWRLGLRYGRAGAGVGQARAGAAARGEGRPGDAGRRAMVLSLSRGF